MPADGETVSGQLGNAVRAPIAIGEEWLVSAAPRTSSIYWTS